MLNVCVSLSSSLSLPPRCDWSASRFRHFGWNFTLCTAHSSCMLLHLECIFTLCRLRHFYTQHLKLIVANMASCCVSLWGCDTVLSSSRNLLFMKKQLYFWVELMYQPVLCSETHACTHTGATPMLSRINGRHANMSFCFRMQMFVFQSLAINMISSTPENCGAVAFKGQQPIRALFAGGQNQSAAPWWHDSFHFTIFHIPASSLRHKHNS